MSMNSLALKRNEGTECRKDRSCFRPEHQVTTVIEPSLCNLTNRARRPTERSHAFASRLRIFHTTHRSLDFLRMRTAKGAFEEIPAQGDTVRPSALERVDVLSFVLVEHSLQDKYAQEGSRHAPGFLSHELVRALQARKNVPAIFVSGESSAAIVFGIHCEAIAWRELDPMHLTAVSLKIGALCRATALGAIP